MASPPSLYVQLQSTTAALHHTVLSPFRWLYAQTIKAGSAHRAFRDLLRAETGESNGRDSPDDPLAAVAELNSNNSTNTNTISAQDLPSFLSIPAELRIKIYDHIFKGSRTTWALHSLHDDLKVATTGHFNVLLTCKACYQEGLDLYQQGVHVVCEGAEGAVFFFHRNAAPPWAAWRTKNASRPLKTPHDTPPKILSNLTSIEGIFVLDICSTVDLRTVCPRLKKVTLKWGKENTYRSMNIFKSVVTDPELIDILEDDFMYGGVKEILEDEDFKAQVHMQVDFIVLPEIGKKVGVPCNINLRTGEISRDYCNTFDFSEIQRTKGLDAYGPWTYYTEQSFSFVGHRESTKSEAIRLRSAMACCPPL